MGNKHKTLKEYFSNFSWLFVIKIYRIAITLLITIYMARYLGPEDFGLYNYALSLVMLFAIFSSLGLEHIFTKELLNKPEEESELLGSAFILKLIGSFFLLSVAVIVTMFLKENDRITIYIVIIFSISFVFKAFEVIRFWFESHLEAKKSTIIEAISISLSVFMKLFMIIYKFPVQYFAWTVLAEGIFLAIGLIWIYQQKGNKILSWKISQKTVKDILTNAWPLILAGALYTVYTKVDQIMLGDMLNNEAVGIYVAAVNISQGWLFIPALIGTAFYPMMIEARKKDRKRYYIITQYLLNILALLGIIIAIIMIFVAKPFILFAFGKSYLESSTVLVIHIWGGVFVAMSAVSYRYFISEGLQKTSFYRGLVGLIVNIFFNLLLIPIYGPIGAAIATVISLVASLYLFNITNKKTRKMFFMQTKALFLVNLIQMLKFMKERREKV